jgi:Plasmid pRiA4b ORF-3-like protein
VPDRLVYVFDADLEGFEGVSRRIEVLADQTLIDVHRALQEAFEWADDHLYSFWLSDHAYDPDAAEFTAPVDMEPGAVSADVRLADIGLAPGRALSYLFDFGDSWEVALRVVAIAKADAGEYPRITAREGDAPPQYSDDED